MFTHVMGCVDHLLMGSHISSPRRGGSTSMFSPAMRGVAARRLVTRYCEPGTHVDSMLFADLELVPSGIPARHSSRRRPRPSSEGKRPRNRVARGSFAGLCGIQPGVSPLEHQTRIVADGARCPADTHARRAGR